AGRRRTAPRPFVMSQDGQRRRPNAGAAGAARLEKAEHAGTVKLLKLPRVPLGLDGPNCGMFVAEHPGTCQTPGLPDLLAFLPGEPIRPVCFIEQKRAGGQLSDDQRTFRVLAETSSALYIAGTMTDVLAWLTDRGYFKNRSLMRELSELTRKADV